MAQSSSTNLQFEFHEDFDENHLNQELEILKHQHFMSSKTFLPENPNRSKENVKNPSKWSSYKVILLTIVVSINILFLFCCFGKVSCLSMSIILVSQDEFYLNASKQSFIINFSFLASCISKF